MARFWGEAFNYKVLGTDTLFDLMYRIINYDSEKLCEWDNLKAFDSSNDSFRIRLICTILDSLGKYFWRGPRKTQMDRFLIFFQRYIFSKSYVLMDLEFMILDTFDQIRPSFCKFQSEEEANEACSKIQEAE